MYDDGFTERSDKPECVFFTDRLPCRIRYKAGAAIPINNILTDLAQKVFPLFSQNENEKKPETLTAPTVFSHEEKNGFNIFPFEGRKIPSRDHPGGYLKFWNYTIAAVMIAIL